GASRLRRASKDAWRAPSARPSFEARKERAPQDDDVRVTLPRPSRRAAPVLQRRPHAAREAEAVDRGRGAQRLEAVQFDAAPLETAFLQDVARRGIGHARAGDQMLDVE